MKVMIAPDSFKGSLTALEVADHIKKGILKVFPKAEVLKVPMADGGEGTVQSLVDATDGEIIVKDVTGPLGDKVAASFGILGNGKTAVIEMATASGLPLVPEDKADPSITTTYGTGELIKHALDQGIEELIIGIGGSATNDAGVGMAQALGASFRDEDGQEIGFGGGELDKIKEIDLSNLDKRIKRLSVNVACDVNNPLYGPEGAAYIYGPQKGADQRMVELLDKNLRYFAEVVKKSLNIDLQSIPGAGAAGGLGAGLFAFLKAELKSGVDIVLEANKFKEKLSGVDLVITGEGKIDGQTVQGKTPVGVAKKAKEKNIPVIAVAGMVAENAGEVYQAGIDTCFSITQRPLTLEEAMNKSGEWLEMLSEQIMRLYKINI
ncbi:glycerate kinase [Iocasia frigidifontis]|uniref:Glycerate kinase n=1 Tax=Iocasia fonsfrigidae TaxID=2682810 RepID=A0A8A7KC21_9FIRM|nr:glycerate kinase [Iocasia fonsfrigidae]QTL99346.1 glycerate kinase [Iocasia fonsfrigidae]